MKKNLRRLAGRAFKSLTYVEDRLGPLLDDPMTSAMGAPVDDFVEKWTNKARRMQADCLEEMQELNVFPRLRDMLIEALTAHI